MSSLTIRRDGDTVILINNDTKLGLSMPWEKALEFSTTLRHQARGIIPADRHQVSRSISVQRDDAAQHEVIEYRGGVFAIIPLESALNGRPVFPVLEIGAAITHVAHLIEEDVKVDEVVFDQALLKRSGRLPGISLTADPYKQHMANVEADHNALLRKSIRARVKPHVIRVGHPTVIKHDPREEQTNG